MMKILFPLLLLVLGLGGGVTAGILIKPEPMTASPIDEAVKDDGPAKTDGHAPQEKSTDIAGVEFLNMSNQFIIPLVKEGSVNGIVVATISLEVVEGKIADVNLLQPKIRDQFLQVLFNHANNGGFDANFTDFRYLKSLKEELLRNAQVVVGRDVTDVLILDLLRQDP